MDVPTRLAACSDRWGLSPGDRLGGGFRSDVFACTTPTGADVVVKLTVTAEEFRSESAALIAWQGSEAAVRLIDLDQDHNALLLERIRPGRHLGGNHPAIDDLVADLLTRLHLSATDTSEFPLLEDLYPRFDSIARDDCGYERRTRGEPERGAVGLSQMNAAAATVADLTATGQHNVLLHGDFLRKNLLQCGTGFRAIDPIPSIGDPCSDIGHFAAGQSPAVILDRAAAIADRMGHDQQRAAQWAAVWTVIQACQAWRDDQEELDALVGSEFLASLLTR